MTTASVARPPLTDRFGRQATDLRISVTDRCNFRCRYCMPPEGMPWMPKDELLSYEEIERLAGILVESGRSFHKDHRGRTVGPARRRQLVRMIRALDEASTSRSRRTATSSADGVRDSQMRDWIASRCRATRSSSHRFADMTLRDALDGVLEGLDAAAELGLTPIKINTRRHPGRQRGRGLTFADSPDEPGYEIRFIEYMPFDAQEEWVAEGSSPARTSSPRSKRGSPWFPTPTTSPNPQRRIVFADGAPGSGRRHPLGHGAVLRYLQPTPADRRRSSPGLSVLLEETDLRDPSASRGHR